MGLMGLRGGAPTARPATGPAGNSFARAGRAWQHGRVLNGLLTGYQAASETEAADVERMRRLAQAAADPWSRSQLPLHLTASALVVHPASRRVLLRWHVKHDRWLQVGGHGDPGETDPLQIALREAREETGLSDLVPWPDETLQHAVALLRAPVGGRPRARAR